MPTTAINAYPYPALTDSPNGPSAFQSLANAVEKRSILIFASATDRTTRMTTPEEGMLCWLQDTNRIEVYDGTTWVEVPQKTADTGWLTAAAATFTVATGWTDEISRVRKIGNRVTLDIQLNRSGANIVATATGNVTDTQLLTLAAAYRPTVLTRAGNQRYIFMGSGAGDIYALCFVSPDDGITYLGGLTPSQTLSTGDRIRATTTFLTD